MVPWERLGDLAREPLRSRVCRHHTDIAVQQRLTDAIEKVKVQSNSPDQKEHNDDHQYRTEAPAIVMVRRTHIETAAAEKEN